MMWQSSFRVVGLDPQILSKVAFHRHYGTEATHHKVLSGIYIPHISADLSFSLVELMLKHCTYQIQRSLLDFQSKPAMP